MKGTVRFTDSLRIRCPASLTEAIEIAAARDMMTPSEYVRRSVIDRIKQDGISPNPSSSLSKHHKQQIESLIPRIA